MKVRLSKKQKIQVNDSKDVYGIMKKILLRENKYGQEKEHFWVVGLDIDNRIIFIELISLGNFTAATVDPNDVFWLATNKRTAGVILVHNHSGENLEPSESDIEITDRLMQAAIIVRTQVLDHLIISPEDFYSFVVSGLFEVLKHSDKFKPRYTEIDRLRKEYMEKGIDIGLKDGVREGLKEGITRGKEEGEKIGIEKGEKNKAIEMAKISIKEGLPTELISKLTGLSEAEINKLSKSKSKTKKKAP